MQIAKILLLIVGTALTLAALWIVPPIENFGTTGQLGKILFFHVPLAWVMTLAFVWSLVSGIRYLRGRQLLDDDRARISAELGLYFGIVATLTGSIFAKNTWGSYWNWDPRETSIFILLLVYFAYFALRQSIEDPAKRRTLASVYTILAGVTVPFLVFVVPRVYMSLHPEDTVIPTAGKINLGGTILLIFLSFLFIYTMLYLWLYRLGLRTAVLERRLEEELES